MANQKNTKQIQERTPTAEPKTAERAEEVTSEGRTEQKIKKRFPKKESEPLYTAGELAANAKVLFGTMPECVTTALAVSGVTKCTKSVAKDIVEKFMKKEVK